MCGVEVRLASASALMTARSTRASCDGELARELDRLRLELEGRRVRYSVLFPSERGVIGADESPLPLLPAAAPLVG